MVTIRTQDSLDGLLKRFAHITEDIDKALDGAVREVARGGNRVAVASARRTAGTHGKRYPSAFTVERLKIADYVYGPDRARPQGNMDFEYGSGRQTAPHLDVTLSRDYVADQLPRKVSDAVRRVTFG